MNETGRNGDERKQDGRTPFFPFLIRLQKEQAGTPHITSRCNHFLLNAVPRTTPEERGGGTVPSDEPVSLAPNQSTSRTREEREAELCVVRSARVRGYTPPPFKASVGMPSHVQGNTSLHVGRPELPGHECLRTRIRGIACPVPGRLKCRAAGRGFPSPTGL